jgi:hypothetical protein
MSPEQQPVGRLRHPLPEELSAGVDDRKRQAETVLAESDERQENRDASPDTVLERRRSEEIA